MSLFPNCNTFPLFKLIRMTISFCQHFNQTCMHEIHAWYPQKWPYINLSLNDYFHALYPQDGYQCFRYRKYCISWPGRSPII